MFLKILTFEKNYSLDFFFLNFVELESWNSECQYLKFVFIGPEPRPELLSTGYMYSGILFYILVKYIGGTIIPCKFSTQKLHGTVVISYRMPYILHDSTVDNMKR